jgi:hypothetical protein
VVDNGPAVRRRYGLAALGGAVIRSIHEGGPAAQYGLPIGAAIVAVDGQVVQSADDLVRTLQTYSPGDVVELKYYEQDRMGRKRVRLGGSSVLARPEHPPVAAAPPAAAPADGPAGTGSAGEDEPPLRLGQGREDRPLLNRLGRALEGILPPAATDQLPAAEPAEPRVRRPPIASPDAPRPAAPAAEVEQPGWAEEEDMVQLWKHVQSLHQQVARLQERVEQLEQELARRAAPSEEPTPEQAR